jgi:hypothetical protein
VNEEAASRLAVRPDGHVRVSYATLTAKADAAGSVLLSFRGQATLSGVVDGHSVDLVSRTPVEVEVSLSLAQAGALPAEIARLVAFLRIERSGL